MAAYFEEEVQFRQKISQYTAFNYLTLNIDLIKSVSLMLVIAINILYLVDLTIDEHDEVTFEHPNIKWINLILAIL